MQPNSEFFKIKGTLIALLFSIDRQITNTIGNIVKDCKKYCKRTYVHSFPSLGIRGIGPHRCHPSLQRDAEKVGRRGLHQKHLRLRHYADSHPRRVYRPAARVAPRGGEC